MAGAIARAGGPVVQAESSAKAPIGLGEAVETSGGEMPCRWVIHAATMELGGPTSADIIRRATESTLSLRGRARRALRLALVAFGTGVGGFSMEDAARIEAEAVRAHLDAGSGLQRVVFAVRGGEAAAAFEAARQRLRPVSASATPSAIIVIPPPVLIARRRRGERPSHSRAVPDASAHVPSDSTATTQQIAASVAS